jgi:hypothetical protein
MDTEVMEVLLIDLEDYVIMAVQATQEIVLLYLKQLMEQFKLAQHQQHLINMRAFLYIQVERLSINIAVPLHLMQQIFITQD